MKNLIVVVVLVIFYIAIIKTAIVPSEELSQQLQRVKHLRIQRALEPTEPPTRIRMCLPSLPCGWAVYVPFKRTVQYFMKNRCECPNNISCAHSHDDVSVNAYVYRCQNITEQDTPDIEQEPN